MVYLTYIYTVLDVAKILSILFSAKNLSSRFKKRRNGANEL